MAPDREGHRAHLGWLEGLPGAPVIMGDRTDELGNATSA